MTDVKTLDRLQTVRVLDALVGTHHLDATHSSALTPALGFFVIFVGIVLLLGPERAAALGALLLIFVAIYGGLALFSSRPRAVASVEISTDSVTGIDPRGNETWRLPRAGMEAIVLFTRRTTIVRLSGSSSTTTIEFSPTSALAYALHRAVDDLQRDESPRES